MMNKEILVGEAVAAVFAIIGCVMVYWGIYFYHQIHSLKSIGVATQGTIVRFETRGNSLHDKDNMVIPIVRFRTSDGKEITFDGSVDNQSKFRDPYKRGDKVEVVYDPNHPDDAKINSFSELWFAPFLLLIIGVCFIFFPPFTVWKYYKETLSQRNDS